MAFAFGFKYVTTHPNSGFQQQYLSRMDLDHFSLGVMGLEALFVLCGQQAGDAEGLREARDAWAVFWAIVVKLFQTFHTQEGGDGGAGAAGAGARRRSRRAGRLLAPAAAGLARGRGATRERPLVGAAAGARRPRGRERLHLVGGRVRAPLGGGGAGPQLRGSRRRSALRHGASRARLGLIKPGLDGWLGARTRAAASGRCRAPAGHRFWAAPFCCSPGAPRQERRPPRKASRGNVRASPGLGSSRLPRGLPPVPRYCYVFAPPSRFHMRRCSVARINLGAH
ncbi:unnamed protein product [Prorocentrum cordatum]|uniref:ELMO domain-containing protein n=1 Tax=Prorocentrum cordatum TaxID=2364126 RepID=A0ABN9XHX8_9DINO|nr:unnamed protein product [Polarella glacialis]